MYSGTPILESPHRWMQDLTVIYYSVTGSEKFLHYVADSCSVSRRICNVHEAPVHMMCRNWTRYLPSPDAGFLALPLDSPV